jgi:HSP20 family protein
MSMFYRNPFSRDIFAELERMQRDLDRTFGQSPSIRGVARGYPAMNVGTTPQSVEVYAFIPGMDPEEIDVQIEKGILAISGERKSDPVPEGATQHLNERFAGRFRRVVALPDDIDANSAAAKYHDGLLHISVARKEAVQPRRITVQ